MQKYMLLYDESEKILHDVNSLLQKTCAIGSYLIIARKSAILDFT